MTRKLYPFSSGAIRRLLFIIVISGMSVLSVNAQITYTIFNPATEVPSQINFNDGVAIEIGLKFKTTLDGTINGIRFYQGSTSTDNGSHEGHLWNTSGSLMATATFTPMTPPFQGWTEVLFSSPVSITAGTTYIASVFSSAGYYCGVPIGDPLRFGSADFDRTPIIVIGNSTSVNGVYTYCPGGASLFPTDSYAGGNYFVDVVFQPSGGDNTPPTVSSVTPAINGTGVSAATTVSATFSEAVSSASITTTTFQLKDPSNNVVTASVSTATNIITLTPSSALAASTAYTATITGGASGVKDLAGNALASNYTWSFTTAASGGGSGGTINGTLNYIPKFMATDAIGNSLMYDNGTAIGIGTTNFTATGYKLFVETGIRTRKIKVDQQTWADDVFDEGYRLPSFAELEAFLKLRKHLLGIPTAAEVQRDGLNLGENQAALLRKIEELTLYIIDLNKRLEKLEQENQLLLESLKKADK